jgi:pimeloyl-ACP methyl ester carboxylesterase
MREEVLLFGRRRSLCGILTRPEETIPDRPAVLLLNAGLVHRAGPHRLYVKIARDLAADGFLVLRFDGSGLGDSLSRQDDLPVHMSRIAETVEAMDRLEADWGIQRFLLIGICSGGTASFHTAGRDHRVSGVLAINGLTFRAGGASALREHLERKSKMPGLADPKRWWRAVRGKMNFRRIARILFAEARTSLAPAEVQAEIGQFWESYEGLTARGVNLLFAYSPGDPGLTYFESLLPSRPAGCSTPVSRIIPESDHTFTSIPGQQRLRETVREWVPGAGWCSGALCDPPGLRHAG